eukprot:TRINITY_DN4106_c0_g1_i2.p1 TRINITY_DN4106_c0_g1~~TRINITY_DN4106_c0_g1_i2.p1  ORF type:complete len:567 (-),score=148.48 TRINITY_DN4106_c0_g1_i2:93-1793(-)
MSMLNGTHIIKGRWKILKKIGQGAFGEIYQAKNILTNEMVAIKVERVDSKKQVLKMEVAVLKKLQDSSYVCRFITCGRFSDYNYMVMELLGENLSELRRRQTDGKFSLSTTIKIGQQMLRAIEAVHNLGYLHRDVKPSNFAMGLTTKKKVAFLIDFGLARRFVLPNGDVRPARDSAGFRGTARYASVNSHLSKDLGRRDDLWSLFYVLVEFSVGSLPWRRLKDKDQIGEMKIATSPTELTAGLPEEFLLFMRHLESLDYMDKPDYKYLQGLLMDMYHKLTPTDTIAEIADDDIALEGPKKSDAATTQDQGPLRHQRSNPSSSRSQKFPRGQDKAPERQGDQKEELEKEEIRSEEEKVVGSPEKEPSLLRRTTDQQMLYRHKFKNMSSDFIEFKPPFAVNPNKQAYVSSTVEESDPFQIKAHRRSYSLPVTLTGNPFGPDEQAQTSTPPAQGPAARAMRSHRHSPSISISFGRKSKSERGKRDPVEEQQVPVGLDKQSLSQFRDTLSQLTKEEDKGNPQSDVNIEIMDVEDKSVGTSKKSKKKSKKTDSNSKLRPRFGSKGSPLKSH